MKKIRIIIMLITCLSFIVMGSVYASSVTLSGSSSGSPNKNVTITIKGDFTGRVNLSVSNGKLNKSSVWIENNSQTVTVTLGESGKTTITATPAEGSSDSSGNIISVAAKSKSISIKKTTTNTTQNTNTTTKKSSNANISKLTLNVEGLSFKTSQTSYNITVGEDIDNIKLGVTLAHKKATYTVSGNKNLKAGDNVIKIVVTAEDGTKKTYKINVRKQGNEEESSAYLSNLIVENMTFESPFITTETEYVGSKMKYAESLNVLPYTVSEQATYEIIGNENLKEGTNTITIKVTSADKTSTVEYKVTFEMMSKEETDALQVVNPYIETSPTHKVEQLNEESVLAKAIREHSTIILLYVLALVEFGQVIYLYVQLKNVDPASVSVKRRNKKKENNKI